MEIKGDLQVCRTIDAARRVNQGLNDETITAAEALDLHSHYWQKLSAAAAQDVILPDATTLAEGWEVVVHSVGAATLTTKTFDPTTPVALQSVESGKAYKFTLIDNTTDEGTWYVNLLEDSETLASARYVETFDATTSWGAAVGGIYTITIPESSHTRGTSPQIQLFEESGSDFVKVDADMKVLANGDLEITVPEDPNCRFAGKAVFI